MDINATSPTTTSTSKTFIASENRKSGKINVVLISSGSVASVKIPLIVEALIKDERLDVQVVATKVSLTFYSKEQVIEKSSGAVKVWTDEDEWGTWSKVGDPILHVELRRWADIVLVAPASANMIAKISNGICDNLATSLLRALDPEQTATYVFPAMNTLMYTHKLTAKQLKIIQEEVGYEVIGPQPGKALACGDVGAGAMTEWTEIVQLVKDFAMEKNASSTSGGSGSSEEDESDDDIITEEYAAQLKNLTVANRNEECKLVLVVNQELGMQKGKIAAQCSHATLACYKTLLKTNTQLLTHWERTGQAKIAVKAQNTAELLELQKKARQLNICAQVISDAGRTQIAAGSKTVLGIGPAPVRLVNQITGHLKLL